jgi:hypothetical protein
MQFYVESYLGHIRMTVAILHFSIRFSAFNKLLGEWKRMNKAGRIPYKVRDKIGQITENWIATSYTNASNSDKIRYRDTVNRFLE